MRIIIEGPDGAGKSTLIKTLAKHFKCDILSMTEFGSKKFEDYEKKAELDNIISDRSFLSELIYAEVAGRSQPMELKHYEKLINCFKNNGWIFLILDAPTNELLRRLQSRGGEDLWKIANIGTLRMLYLMWAKFYDLPIIDTTTLDVDQLLIDLEDGKYEPNYSK